MPFWFGKRKPSRQGAIKGVVDIPGAYNLRELGGYPSKYGRTLDRRYLRSGSLGQIGQAGTRQLFDYGVRRVLDLRGKDEVEGDPDLISRWPGVESRNIELYSFDMSDPKLDRGDDEGGYLAAGYFTMLANRAAIRDIFDFLASTQDNRCLLFHCSAGMDRTGVVAMLILGLAGVPRDEIVADYAYSFGTVAEVNAAVFGRRRGKVQNALSLRIGAIEVTYDRLLDAYGSVADYLRSCGVTDAQLGATVRHLVV